MSNLESHYQEDIIQKVATRAIDQIDDVECRNNDKPVEDKRWDQMNNNIAILQEFATLTPDQNIELEMTKKRALDLAIEDVANEYAMLRVTPDLIRSWIMPIKNETVQESEIQTPEQSMQAIASCFELNENQIMEMNQLVLENNKEGLEKFFENVFSGQAEHEKKRILDMTATHPHTKYIVDKLRQFSPADLQKWHTLFLNANDAWIRRSGVIRNSKSVVLSAEYYKIDRDFVDNFYKKIINGELPTGDEIQRFDGEYLKIQEISSRQKKYTDIVREIISGLIPGTDLAKHGLTQEALTAEVIKVLGYASMGIGRLALAAKTNRALSIVLKGVVAADFSVTGYFSVKNFPLIYDSIERGNYSKAAGLATISTLGIFGGLQGVRALSRMKNPEHIQAFITNRSIPFKERKAALYALPRKTPEEKDFVRMLLKNMKDEADDIRFERLKLRMEQRTIYDKYPNLKKYEHITGPIEEKNILGAGANGMVVDLPRQNVVLKIAHTPELEKKLIREYYAQQFFRELLNEGKKRGLIPNTINIPTVERSADVSGVFYLKMRKVHGNSMKSLTLQKEYPQYFDKAGGGVMTDHEIALILRNNNVPGIIIEQPTGSALNGMRSHFPDQADDLEATLKYLRENGFEHTDFHDINLMVDKEGNFFMIDFGSVKMPADYESQINNYYQLHHASR